MYSIAKVCLVGDPGCGKSTFGSALARTQETHGNADPIDSIRRHNKPRMMSIHMPSVRFDVWDIGDAASSEFREVMEGTLCCPVLYDFTNLDSFKHATDLWYPMAREYAPNAFVMLIGTKADLVQSRQVGIAQAQKFAEENEIYFMEVSSWDATNVKLTMDIIHTQCGHAIDLRERARASQDYLERTGNTAASSAGPLWSDLLGVNAPSTAAGGEGGGARAPAAGDDAAMPDRNDEDGEKNGDWVESVLANLPPVSTSYATIDEILGRVASKNDHDRGGQDAGKRLAFPVEGYDAGENSAKMEVPAEERSAQFADLMRALTDITHQLQESAKDAPVHSATTGTRTRAHSAAGATAPDAPAYYTHADACRGTGGAAAIAAVGAGADDDEGDALRSRLEESKELSLRYKHLASTLASCGVTASIDPASRDAILRHAGIEPSPPARKSGKMKKAAAVTTGPSLKVSSPRSPAGQSPPERPQPFRATFRRGTYFGGMPTLNGSDGGSPASSREQKPDEPSSIIDSYREELPPAPPSRQQRRRQRTPPSRNSPGGDAEAPLVIIEVGLAGRPKGRIEVRRGDNAFVLAQAFLHANTPSMPAPARGCVPTGERDLSADLSAEQRQLVLRLAATIEDSLVANVVDPPRSGRRSVHRTPPSTQPPPRSARRSGQRKQQSPAYGGDGRHSNRARPVINRLEVAVSRGKTGTITIKQGDKAHVLVSNFCKTYSGVFTRTQAAELLDAVEQQLAASAHVR